MSTLPTTLPRFLWHFAKRFKRTIAVFLFVALWWATNVSLNSYILKVIIDAVASATPETLVSATWLPATCYVLLGLAIGVVFRLYDLAVLQMFPQIKSDMAQGMFEYVEQHSYKYFQQNFAGSLTNKINDMAKNATKLISTLIDIFIARTCAFVIGMGMMYLVHPYFAFVIITWAILFLSISWILSKKSQHFSEVFSESRSVIVGKIVDSISNILNVKLFARERYESTLLRQQLDDTVTKDKNLQWYLFKVKVFQTVAIVLLLAITITLLLWARAHELVTIGDFALILTITVALIDELFFVAKELVEFSEDVGVCTQALSIISPPHDIVDAPDAVPLHVTRGEIIFDKVHFQYRKGQNVFTDKSITIAPGQKVGLVGFSGGGKSTFVNLILRFFDIDSGQILIDGQDIKKVLQESLRSQIAMIPQDPVLFHRSLMENIRYGRLEASDDEVVACSERAHCHEFIVKLKEGYNSLVGERGVKLSGGQRQRIAIARAMLKNSRLLILDEATSSLDSVTEEYIQQSLATLMQGRTTIVVAHRLSTLYHMDRILVFHEGRIIEDGAHNELIELNDHYTKLWSMQARGFLGNHISKG